jgi:hypothetical protein
VDVDSIMSDCVRNLGLRIGPHTGTYLLKHLQSPQRPEKVPVMGGDARTGLPIRTFIPLDRLAQNANNAAATPA